MPEQSDKEALNGKIQVRPGQSPGDRGLISTFISIEPVFQWVYCDPVYLSSNIKVGR
jgi:hypothetical protein